MFLTPPFFLRNFAHRNVARQNVIVVESKAYGTIVFSFYIVSIEILALSLMYYNVVRNKLF